MKEKQTDNNDRRRPSPPLPGTTHVNIQLPEHLHEKMKAIREKRRQQEGSDVKISRVYREAIEQYIRRNDPDKTPGRTRRAAQIFIAHAAGATFNFDELLSNVFDSRIRPVRARHHGSATPATQSA